MSVYRLRNVRSLALAVLSSSAVYSSAQTFSRTYTTAPVHKTSMSVWPAGQDTGSNLSKVFIGPSWDLSNRSLDAYGDLKIPAIDWGLFTTPAINLGRTGFQVRYGGSGKVGFDVQPYYSGGAMDLSYIGAVTVTGLPSLPQAGQTVTLNLSYHTAGASNFSVTSPTVGVGMDGVCNISGNASSTGWFLGSTVWDGNIFSPFDTKNRATIFGLTTLDNDHVNQIASALNGLNIANPLPIGASISVPDLAVTGNTVNTSTGALTGTTFSTFCTVETNAMDWILMLIPGAKGVVSGLVLSGNYPVPGTGAVVGWDIAKIYADMNLGFTADYAVSPVSPALGVDVYTLSSTGAETLYASSSTSSISFSMPNSRIRVRPRVSFDLSLASSLGIGMQGEIGTSPIALTLDGSIGSGSHAETYHVDVDPAHLAWTSDPKGLGKIKSGTVPLGHYDQTFDGTYIALANLNDLPPNVYPGTAAGTNTNGDVPIEIHAYALDPDTDGDPRYTMNLAPEQGYTFFKGSAGSNVTAEVVPAVTGGTEQYFDPIPPFIKGQQQIELQFHSQDLKPGRYVLHTTVYGTNQNGVAKRADYRTRFNINYAEGVIDGQFYKNDNPANAINRVVADGTDQRFQFMARNFYQDTEVVLNGFVVLPRQSPNDQDDPNSINDGQQITATVPAAVAKRFAGSLNTVQLRTRDLSGDGTGFILSDPQPLFIVAGAPTLSRIQYKDTANAMLPIGTQDVTFEADGTNLSQATTVSAIWTRDGVATTTPLTTAYATPTALRVTLPASFIADFHSHSSNGSLSIRAATPTAVVPADHYSPQVTSGGTSSALGLKLAHPAPTITRFEPSILIKDSGAQTIKVYGDNLLRDPSAYYADDLAADFGPGATVAYPSGTGLSVPYLLVTLPADHPAIRNVGNTHVRVNYRDAKSLENDLITEYGKPTLDTNTTYRLVMGASGADLTLGGAPFYKDATKLFLNGIEISGVKANSSTSLFTHVPASITGATATAKVTNLAPGGGDSNTVTVSLLEGDPNTVKVVPGALVYDRPSNTYKQSFAVTYVGTRNVSSGAHLVFTNVPAGVKLTNASGTTSGKPFLNTSLVPRRQVTVVAAWSKTGATAIDSTTNVVFPY